MIVPHGDIRHDFIPLGKKVEKAPAQPAAPAPVPGIDPGKHIQIDSLGRLSTNNPANEGANVRDGTTPVRTGHRIATHLPGPSDLFLQELMTGGVRPVCGVSGSAHSAH